MQLKIILNALAVGASVALLLGSNISSSVDPFDWSSRQQVSAGQGRTCLYFIVIKKERIFFLICTSCGLALVFVTNLGSRRQLLVHPSNAAAVGLKNGGATAHIKCFWVPWKKDVQPHRPMAALPVNCAHLALIPA